MKANNPVKRLSFFTLISVSLLVGCLTGPVNNEGVPPSFSNARFTKTVKCEFANSYRVNNSFLFSSTFND